jgi:hypothetical protein
MLGKVLGLTQPLTLTAGVRNKWSYTSNSLTARKETAVSVTVLIKSGNECTAQLSQRQYLNQTAITYSPLQFVFHVSFLPTGTTQSVTLCNTTRSLRHVFVIAVLLQQRLERTPGIC